MATRQPALVKTAVIAKTALGQPKTKIAEDLGITTPTVRRILDEAEFATLVDEGKSALYESIPEAVQTYLKVVRKKPLEAKDFLERVTVLPAKPQAEQHINNGIVIQYKRDPIPPQVVLPSKPEV